MKYILHAVLLFSAFSATSQIAPVTFTQNMDIGTVNIKGSLQYDGESQHYTLRGSGQNIWAKHDDFHFAWKKMTGDFIADAQLHFSGNGAAAHRKAGWMARQSLEPNAAYADAAIHGDGLSSLQFRRMTDSLTEEIKATVTAPDVIRLERKGSTYIFSGARFGEPLREYGRLELNLGDDVFVGLFICSHEENTLEEAVFSNVRITVPAKNSFVPYRDYPGSRMEILDVASGTRQMIYSSPETFEAPNWMKDGRSLIYNSKGSLYSMPLDTKKPAALNTGFAKSCNNDHILSPDNKQIGISNQGTEKGEGGSSLIYIVSLDGSGLRLVTKDGPSYLHGWSPDGQTLAYCANRQGNFDVYTISVKGGQEKRLTTARGLDDGPEYSPDGKTIYFNSSRSGSMQIWKMNADGSDQQQITRDDYQNWFAHISPDGTRMAFISFEKEVSSEDHPPCKKVMIRMMPVSGSGPAKVVAYIYGGQGTINVPSWSPDGTKLAFVSNTFPDDYYKK